MNYFILAARSLNYNNYDNSFVLIIIITCIS